MAIDTPARALDDELPPEPSLDTQPVGERPPRSERGEPRPATVGALQLVMAACVAAAGVIHLAMAPTHLAESGSDGVSFFAAGWVQIALAVLLVARPRRWVLAATMTASAVFIGAWIVSRTAGLPYGAHSGHAADAGFVDGVAVALEAVALAGAAGLLLRGVSLGGARPRVSALTGLAILAVLGLTTAALASPSARDHAAASHGDHGGADAAHGHDGDTPMAGGADGGATHDHGAGATPAAPATDHGHASATPGAAGLSGHDHSALEGMENGQHRPMVQRRLSPLTQARLDTQLAATREVAAMYPTVAHAEAAGYRRAGPFTPGLGAHYIRSSVAALNADGVMDEADLREPMSLIYHGTNGDAPLAGFMYYSVSAAEPTGFVGPNDVWHYHKQVCVAFEEDGTVNALVGDLQSPEVCAAAGGQIMEITNWMVHVWSVPGYEVSRADGGVFAEVNPALTCGDGSYDTAQNDVMRPLNTCKSDIPPEQSSPLYEPPAGHAHEGEHADDLGLGMLQNGHHAEIAVHELDQETQAELDAQIAATRRVAGMYPTVADAMAAGYRRAGPFAPGLGVHFTRPTPQSFNPDGVMDAEDLANPMSIIYEGIEPDAKIAGFMYYSFAGEKPEGFAGPNDEWHYHTNVCITTNPDGGTDAPLGADRSVSQADCDRVGGTLIGNTGWMVHVWSVPGYGLSDELGGMFGEVQPKLTCPDGTYFMMAPRHWPDHPYSVCRSELRRGET